MTSGIANLVAELHEKREYRPVGVALLYRGEGADMEFLVLKSSKWPDAYLFSQGGIDPGETLEDSLPRELEEELGVNFATDVTDVVLGYHVELMDYEATRSVNRGFSKGKAYFFSMGRYIGDGNFVLQDEEVESAHWMGYDEAVRHFEMGRPEKAALLKKGLDIGIELLAA